MKVSRRKSSLRFAVCQFNPKVGDPAGNADRLQEFMASAQENSGVQILIAPELALCGYPPEDLLLREDFLGRCEESLARLALHSTTMALLVGHPQSTEQGLRNRASVFLNSRRVAFHDKRILPNYAVFDEQRYFQAGEKTAVFELEDLRIGLLICEDAWTPEPSAELQAVGVDLVVVINASPFSLGKAEKRLATIRARQAETGLPFIYVNQAGGQDDLVFDGGSFCLGKSGAQHYLGTRFKEQLVIASFDRQSGEFELEHADAGLEMPDIAQLHAAIVLGLRDYVGKNGCQKLLLGLSGGIDSAVTLALAVSACGAQNVRAVMLPSDYTSNISLDGAREQAKAEGVRYDVIPIADMLLAARSAIADDLVNVGSNTTTENLQSRIRGTLLMALSNQSGALLLATGNKSEMAVGYATIYGDMCGAYAPLKDVYKTQVYALARFINQSGGHIPIAVIDRPPSAELAPNQKDSDSLPAYDILDALLVKFIDEDLSVAELVAQGFDAEMVQRMTRLVYTSEFKRRQSAPGPKVSSRAFGRERRFPISSGWK